MQKTSDIYFPTGEIEKAFINFIWRLSENDLHKRKEIILPKGTVEIIFNFSDEINYFNPSQQVSKKLPIVFVNGINFKPFELTKTGRQEFLGIQLNSIGLRLLFNISAKEFNNSVYDGKELCTHLDSLANALFHQQTFAQQVNMILVWIRNKIPFKNYQHSIDRVQKLKSYKDIQNLSVKKICEEIYLSDRQLRRFSQDWLGMNTEEFILYGRYLNCLNLLHYSKQSLTAIGLKAGYYDQSHFIREFKAYTDLTPKQYQEANTDLPGHIFV
ncbi:MAG: helix-turn-helix transcriptional regulator [Saprospiraceae bacterium]|nr:helix-turn-helix transcriptional regulator [Saprospiraceae bacterium]